MKALRLALGLTALLFVLAAPDLAQAQVPASWGCDANLYQDGTCDCGCGANDADCPPGRFVVCERSGCPLGEVPWEHQPATCMRSACGDGWRDDAMGELCDDGDGLAGGGCSANCSAVTEGWTCGERAEGCEEEAQPDAGVEPDSGPEVDAGSATDSGVSDPDAGVATPDSGSGQATSDEASGCSTSGSSPVVPLAGLIIGWGYLARTTRRRRAR